MRGGNLVGGHLFEHDVRVSMLFQPGRGRLTIVGEMDEFRVHTGAIENTDRTKRGTFENLEGQVGIETKRSVNADDDGILAVEIRLVQREMSRRGVIAGLVPTFLADQAAAAVAGLPGRQLLVETLGRARCAIAPGDDGPIGARS